MAQPFSAALPYLGPTTAAAVAAAPGPSAPDGKWIYVDEFDATYRWVAGSAVVADGFRVLSHTGGVAGRWILDGTHITLSPRGGVLDDWARLIGGACVAMAYHGEVWMNAGTWLAKTNQVVPSGTVLRGNPGVNIVSSLVDLSPIDFGGSVFFSLSDRVVVTTLGVAGVPGDIAVTVVDATAIAINSRILIQHAAAYWTQRIVINKVGNVLTLDRPLLRPFSIGNDVLTLNPTTGGQDIYIYGGGLTVTGTGTAVVEFVCAKDCWSENIIADVTTRFGLCWDVGSRDCAFSNCSIDNNGTALTSGYLVALSETCDILDCDSYRGGAANIYWSSNDNCKIVGGVHTGSLGSGLLAAVDSATDTIGNQGCIVENAVFSKAAISGIVVFGAGRNLTFVGVEASFCQSGMAFQDAAGGTVQDCVVLGGVVRGNTVLGLGVNASKGIRVVGQLADAPYAYECNNGGELELADCSMVRTYDATVGVNFITLTGATSVLRVNGCKAVTGVNAHHFARVSTAGAQLYIDGATRYESTFANGVGVLVDAGVARVSGFVVVSAGGGISSGIYLNGVTAYARVADDCDFSATTTPLANPGAGAFNRSLPGAPIALTGAVAVALAFPDTKATDRCFTTLVAAGGVPAGMIFTGAPVVGVGFNVNGIALDTSTFHYDIH